MHEKKTSRRKYLLSVGALGASGLAGCSSSGDGGDGDGGDNGGSGGDGSDDGTDGGSGSDSGDDGSDSSGSGSGGDSGSTDGGDGSTGDSDGSSGSDSGGDDDGTSDGTDETTPTADGDGGSDDGGSEPKLCSDLTGAEYSRYDEADTPFVPTFEYPLNSDGSDTVAATGSSGDTYSLTIRKYLGDRDFGDRQPFDIFPTQYTSGTSSRTAIQKGEGSGLSQVGELTFDGETVPLIRAEPGATGDTKVRFYNKEPYYIVGLPYNGTYYRFDLRASVRSASDLEAGDCQDSWEQVGMQMMNSLQLNADTTVDSADS
jgi:hypothetical protein